MLASRPAINNTKAPSKVNGARSSNTFSTKGGRCYQSMNISMMASAAPDWIARPWTVCGTRRGAVSSMPVVILSPDRLARNYAHQWLLIEEFEKMNTQLIFLQNPFGDSPQGKLLTQMQGMIAEYERAQIAERTRRGRLEKARHGEFIPWAYTCYGYRYLPKRHGCAPQVMIDPVEAAIVRDIYRALVEEQLSCRQITKRLNAAKTPTPTGKNSVWQPATVRNILTNRAYAGQARYNYRQPVIPQYRKTRNTNCSISKPGAAIAQKANGSGAKRRHLSASSSLIKRNANCSAMLQPHVRCTNLLHAVICYVRSSNAASAGWGWCASDN